MRLTRCSCTEGDYFRLQRSWWMRLLSDRRLYQCSKCRAVMLLPLAEVFSSTAVVRTS